MTNQITGSGTTGHFVHANGIDIYCEEAGSGQPLLLLHGGAHSLSMWAPHMPVLGQHFRVIALDSRGHGRTKNTIDSMTYRLLADDTVSFIRALGLDQPLICGWSDGGQIAMEIGIHYPGLMKASIIYGSTYRWPADYPGWLRRLGFESEGVVDTDRTERDALRMVTLLRKYQDAYQGDGYWKSYLRQVSYMWLPAVGYIDEDLKKIVDPMLIFAGDRDNAAIPVEDAVHMYRTIPGAELAIAPGSDHMLPVSNPGKFLTVALDFFQRHMSTAKQL